MSVIKIGTIPQDELDAENTLLPRQFAWLLAYNGWDDVWDAVQSTAKSSNLELYATLKAQQSAGVFLLSETLAFLSNPAVQAIAESVAPDVDLSEDNVRDKWDEAKNANLSATE